MSETLDAMKELQVARLGLMNDRTAANSRKHVCRSPLLKRHAAKRLAQIIRQIAAIDAELKASLTREPEIAVRFEVLVSIPGIGEPTAIACSSKCPNTGLSTASMSHP